MSTFPLVGHMSKEPRLKDRVCVISGASRGFGQAIAIRFVEEGAKVVLLSRSSCKETLDLIRTIDGLADADAVTLWCACDIGSEDEIKAAMGDIEKKFGEAIHVLINNAALFVFHSVEHASAEDWDRSAAVNIKGHALLTKHALPLMKKAPKGTASIVFQGSISSFLAQPNCATYATMKGAIVQMARNCAYDFAKYNIRVNSICAGTIETPISADERLAHGWTFDQWESLKTKDVMMGRVGNVREIANATLFFSCEESSYCTGTHLMVDGGQTPCTTME
eukprot:TRINITY_DN6177_c0_g1_i1.p1 TRINITY_DN6177_c0_g1~~TRINITY_DN6177_c0_g1_i1.p1  ORF type:complete len:279 (-),score=73.63 TRINITY_DN6177_c0_g1_i1:121-957(-)